MNRREFFKRAMAVVGMGVLGATVAPSKPALAISEFPFSLDSEVTTIRQALTNYKIGSTGWHTHSISDHTPEISLSSPSHTHSLPSQDLVDAYMRRKAWEEARMGNGDA